MLNKSFDHNHLVSNIDFDIQEIKERNKRRRRRRLKYLHLEFEIQIISRHDQLIVREVEFSCARMTHYVLYVNSKRSIVTNILHTVTFDL